MKRYFVVVAQFFILSNTYQHFLGKYFSMYQASLLILGAEGDAGVATRSGKHSLRRRMQIVECG